MNAPGAMDNLVREFLLETGEGLQQVDQDFVTLERDPADRETLARIFRAVHTLKGSCGFLGFARLQALAHAGEGLLGLLRDGSLRLDKEMTTTLLAMVDAVREALAAIEATGTEGATDHAPLIAALGRHRGGDPSPPAPSAASPAKAGGPPLSTAPGKAAPAPGAAAFVDAGGDLLARLDLAFATLQEDPRDVAALEAVSSAFGGARGGCEGAALPALAAILERADELLEALRRRPEAASSASVEALLEAATTLADVLATLRTRGSDAGRDPAPVIARLEAAIQIASAPAGPTAAAPTPSGAAEPVPASGDAESRSERAMRRASVAEQTIRVDVGLVDQLMNQVGELVLARNQILRHVRGGTDDRLAAMAQRLNQLTTELQETVMRTRLQPIDTVWNRLPRMVRDLSLELGKRVRLVMEGADTELDRTLNEAIRAPLTHLVRNAIDHGLESEAERRAAGKPAEGTLALRAWHEGGQVNVEIADDGKGIDLARVTERALAQGLISPERAAAMTDREKIDLVFLPGFSTATRVTSVSGRGVGMDVVRTSVEQINGLIDVSTVQGKGTRIRLKIPLTLAIIPALIVRAAGERYAIPQLSLAAVVRLSGEKARAGVERMHDAPVYRWRGRLLPLVSLRRELGLEPEDLGQGVTVVVLQVEDRRFGLVVDEVVDTEEIVVKPLGTLIGRIPVFAGATIMGDGRPAIILDALGLAQSATLVSARAEPAGASRMETSPVPCGEARTVLLVRVDGERVAVPLTDAVRLERFPRAAVETSGGRPVVKYRGAALPLSCLGAARDLGGPAGVLDVVVHARDGQAQGFVVDELLDIVRETFVVQAASAAGPGVLGTALIQDRVARVIDLAALRPGSEVR